MGARGPPVNCVMDGAPVWCIALSLPYWKLLGPYPEAPKVTLKKHWDVIRKTHNPHFIISLRDGIQLASLTYLMTLRPTIWQAKSSNMICIAISKQSPKTTSLHLVDCWLTPNLYVLHIWYLNLHNISDQLIYDLLINAISIWRWEICRPELKGIGFNTDKATPVAGLWVAQWLRSFLAM